MGVEGGLNASLWPSPICKFVFLCANCQYKSNYPTLFKRTYRPPCLVFNCMSWLYDLFCPPLTTLLPCSALPCCAAHNTPCLRLLCGRGSLKSSRNTTRPGGTNMPANSHSGGKLARLSCAPVNSGKHKRGLIASSSLQSFS